MLSKDDETKSHLLATIFDTKNIHLVSNEHLYMAEKLMPILCFKNVPYYIYKSMGKMKLAKAWKGTGDILSIHWKILAFVNRTCITYKSKFVLNCVHSHKKNIDLITNNNNRDPMDY